MRGDTAIQSTILSNGHQTETDQETPELVERIGFQRKSKRNLKDSTKRKASNMLCAPHFRSVPGQGSK